MLLLVLGRGSELLSCFTLGCRIALLRVPGIVRLLRRHGHAWLLLVPWSGGSGLAVRGSIGISRLTVGVSGLTVLVCRRKIAGLAVGNTAWLRILHLTGVGGRGHDGLVFVVVVMVLLVMMFGEMVG